MQYMCLKLYASVIKGTIISPIYSTINNMREGIQLKFNCNYIESIAYQFSYMLHITQLFVVVFSVHSHNGKNL